jgi:hypothetical protein
MLFVMFVTTEYLVYYPWLTNRYDCPVNVCSLYETCTTAGGVFVMGIIKKPLLKVCQTEPVLELWYSQKQWLRKESKVFFYSCVLVISSVTEQSRDRLCGIGIVLEILYKSEQMAFNEEILA